MHRVCLAACCAWGLAPAFGCNALFEVDDLTFDAPVGAGGEGSTATTTTTTTTAGGGFGGMGGAGGGGGAPGGGGAMPDTFCDEAGLIACFPFDGDALDHGPLGNEATEVGATLIDGQRGQALAHDETTVVGIPSNATLSPVAITLETWVRLDAVPLLGRMAFFDHAGHWGMFALPGGYRCTASTSIGSIDSPMPPVAGVWTHVACTLDATELRMYVDGALVATASGGLLPTTPASEDIKIGSNAPTGDALDGALDDARIFDHARAPTLDR